ncbi:phosphonate C-P lyase system protein PhnG [Roseovarius salinarum]|uniref:phosphonate C-P lyase system protein PhnG n=1 Tax=Roseovarius salinarum TaxID=1981892 RepID=UPI000C34052D|nr:phosphonate C-P lyase system protein PhnG [Roseovarius salinarum]
MAEAAEQTERNRWMSLLAKAPAEEVTQRWEALGGDPEFTVLRAPEVGGVMVRGRAGATGAPFNLGEMTVTRCSVRLSCGTVGHAYVQGRDKGHARRAALADALMQTDRAGEVRAALLAPIEALLDGRRQARAARAAATKVDFFTMARGED